MSFDDHIRSTLDRALTAAREHLEADLRAATEELSRAATAERSAAIDGAVSAATSELRRQTEAELQALRDSIDGHALELRSATEAAEVQVTEARRAQQGAEAACEQERAAARAAEQAREAADRAQHAAQEARVAAEQALETAERARQDAQQALETAERARHDAEQTLEATDRSWQGAEQARDTAERSRDAAERGREAAEEARAAAERRLDDAQREAQELLTRTVERAAVEHQRLESAEARARARYDAVLAREAHLAESIGALDNAATLSEVLNVLAERCAGEAGRSSVLLVRGGRLVGWKFMGFSRVIDVPRSVDLSLDDAGLVGAAVTSVGMQSSHSSGSNGAGTALPPFAADVDGPAVAIPLVVGGSVVAVVYADSTDAGIAPESAHWFTLEILVRHASRVLEAMTAKKAAGLSPAPAPRDVPSVSGMGATQPGGTSMTGSVL